MDVVVSDCASGEYAHIVIEPIWECMSFRWVQNLYWRIDHAFPESRNNTRKLYWRPTDTEDFENLTTPSLGSQHNISGLPTQYKGEYWISRISRLPIQHRRRENIVYCVNPVLSKQGTYTTISILGARRYEGSCDRISVPGDAYKTPISEGMDTSSIQAFSKNGPSRRWTITRGRIVVVTLVGLYFAGQGRVVAVTCRDPILVRIVLFESSGRQLEE